MILLEPDARPTIGHRGASGAHPENTIRAFDAALEQGADALELDVRVSSDGVIVVMHDSSVEQTTNGAGDVAGMTLDRLRSLDAGHGERVPTLEEVLERYPDLPLIVEIKVAQAALGVGSLLDRLGARHRVLCGAFAHASLKPLRGRGVHLTSSRRETAYFWVASRFGIAVSGAGYEAFTVPERDGAVTVVDPRFVKAARRAGKPVHVWTVNTADDARRLRRIGASGIITNFPDRIVRSA